MSWLGDRQAVCVLSFDVDAESVILAEGARFAGHVMAMTHQAYGPRIGVPRLLRLLSEYSIRATFFVPGFTADRHGAVIQTIAEHGHEIGYHSYSHRTPTSLTADEERADFNRAVEALDRLGVEPVGHRAAMWEPTSRTLDLVREHGLLYDSSLMDDDRPYILDEPDGAIVELPPHWSLDDWEQFAYLPEPDVGQVIQSPARVLEMWTNELDAMRRHHCLFMLTCHPFLIGRPSRIEMLRGLIESILERGDVAILPAEQVARQALVDPTLDRRALDRLELEHGLFPDSRCDHDGPNGP